MDIWKAIPGYEGLYEASQSGKIRSLDRVIVRGAGISQRFPGKLLCPSNSRTGYDKVGLCKNGIRGSQSVHSLVAITFLGPRPAGMVVDHIDGNRTNNNIDNLRYLTVQENLANRHGAAKAASGVCGVHRKGARWEARMDRGGRRYSWGSYKTISEAKQAVERGRMLAGLALGQQNGEVECATTSKHCHTFIDCAPATEKT